MVLFRLLLRAISCKVLADRRLVRLGVMWLSGISRATVNRECSFNSLEKSLRLEEPASTFRFGLLSELTL